MRSFRKFPKRMLFTTLACMLLLRTSPVEGLSAPAYKEHVVVVGGGIGGLSTSFDLRHNVPKDVKISVISDRPSFQFTPSNPWVALGIRKPEDISIPMTEACRAGKVDYLPGRLVRVDAKQRKAYVIEPGESKETSVPYDYLVAATGPKLQWDGLLDPEKSKLSDISVCTTPHAESAHEAYHHLLNKGGGGIVVGAMQGASCFGPAYEFIMMLDHELRAKGIRDKCPMTFVTSEPYVGHMGLAGIGESHKLMTKMLKERDIRVITNCELDKVDHKNGIVRVTETCVSPTEIDAHVAAGEDLFPWSIPSNVEKKRHKIQNVSFVMMIPKFAGQDCWKASTKGVADKSAGTVFIDEYMRNPTFPEIFGVGVCAKFQPVEKTPIPTGAPKTGYLIESMGTATALNIKEAINANREGRAVNEKMLKRPSLDALCLTDLGGNDGALFLASPELPPRRRTETAVNGMVKLAKVAFEKYFLFKIRTGDADPFYEKFMLKFVGIERLKHD